MAICLTTILTQANANDNVFETDTGSALTQVSSTTSLRITKDGVGRPVQIDHPTSGALSISYDNTGRVSALQSRTSLRQVFFGYYDENAYRPSTVTVSRAGRDAFEGNSTRTFLVNESFSDGGSIVLGASLALHGSINDKYLPDQRKYQLILQDPEDWDPYQYDWESDLGFDPFRWMEEDWSQPPPLPREQCIVECTEACQEQYEYAMTLICPFYAPAIAMFFSAPSGPGALLAGAAATAACGGAMVYGKNGCRGRCESRCR